MLVRVLLSILPLLDQLNAHRYYGQKCIPDSEILLPHGRCFCNIRGRINLCVGLYEREDAIRRSEPEKSKIGRIVGGENAPIAQYPYMLAFERDGLLWCGATIIHVDWAITAAHCFDGIVVNFKCIEKIRAGSSKLEEGGHLFDVVQVFIHEEYKENLKNHAYDMAVVKVNKPFRDASKTLIMAKLPAKDYEMPVGTMVTVVGWGKTEETGDVAKELQKVQLPIVALATCRYVYGRLITSHMICAGYSEGKRDACQADSGGPMFIDHTLVGLVAFGEGCARPDRPGVYIRVASFRDWIKKKTGV